MPGRGVRSAVLPGTPSQQRSAELLTAACPVIDTQLHTQTKHSHIYKRGSQYRDISFHRYGGNVTTKYLDEVISYLKRPVMT